MSGCGLLAGSVADGTDWVLPAIVTDYGDGQNTITSATFAALPTTPVAASITNPHPTARMLIMVEFGAWIRGTVLMDVRVGLSVSGSIAQSAGVGGWGPAGWGEILYNASDEYIQDHSMVTYELPPSGDAAIISIEAAMAGTGSSVVDYPTLRILPLRFIF